MNQARPTYKIYKRNLIFRFFTSFLNFRWKVNVRKYPNHQNIQLALSLMHSPRIRSLNYNIVESRYLKYMCQSQIWIILFLRFHEFSVRTCMWYKWKLEMYKFETIFIVRHRRLFINFCFRQSHQPALTPNKKYRWKLILNACLIDLHRPALGPSLS